MLKAIRDSKEKPVPARELRPDIGGEFDGGESNARNSDRPQLKGSKHKAPVLKQKLRTR